MILRKTNTKYSPIQKTTSIPESEKLDNYLVKPLKSGFKGFTTIFMIIMIINLLLFTVGVDAKFGVGIFDILLAGAGFFLKLAATLLESII